jgi:hypothetical protein
MKQDYALEGITREMTLKFEEKVARRIELMAEYTGFSPSELVNVAMKRFISQHKDFLPPKELVPQGKSKKA